MKNAALLKVKLIGILICLFICLFVLAFLAHFSETKNVSANTMAILLILVFGLCLLLELRQYIISGFKVIMNQIFENLNIS